MRPHIGVVIAGHERHVLRCAEAGEKGGGAGKLGGQADIDEVAEDGDVVRLPRAEVALDRCEGGRVVMHRAAQAPVHIADEALADELGGARLGQRRQMRIGEMGEREHEGQALRKDSVLHSAERREILKEFLKEDWMLKRLLHVYWRFARGLTLGVRGAVLDAEGRVLLVRHGYVEGWHLPGGGVEPGETLLDALERELREEGNVALTGAPVLHGIFFNDSASRRDHVALYLVRAFEWRGEPAPTLEIREARFFPLENLPEGTTAATRRRLDEIARGAPPAANW